MILRGTVLEKTTNTLKIELRPENGLDSTCGQGCGACASSGSCGSSGSSGSSGSQPHEGVSQLARPFKRRFIEIDYVSSSVNDYAPGTPIGVEIPRYATLISSLILLILPLLLAALIFVGLSWLGWGEAPRYGLALLTFCLSAWRFPLFLRKAFPGLRGRVVPPGE